MGLRQNCGVFGGQPHFPFRQTTPVLLNWQSASTQQAPAATHLPVEHSN
jgi:hypothetical protein